MDHTGTRRRREALGNARYSHILWLTVHGPSCRCAMCRLHRTEREAVKGAVDALDIVLSLWIAEAWCGEG